METDQSLGYIQQWLTRMMLKERLAHAYLFVGNKGAGKRKMALFFAQALYCQQKKDGQPCQLCGQCKRIENRNHPDVHWIEPDGASIKIDQVRWLQKEFSYRGVEEGKKLYIIQQVELMTTQAANSLLKFLEEPHLETYALLLTEQKHFLLPTIISRCQEMIFPPPSPAKVKEALRGEFGESLASLASQITADVEEGYTLCQSNEFADARTLVIQLVEEVEKTSPEAIFLVQDKWTAFVKDRNLMSMALDCLLLWYKDLLYIKTQAAEAIVYNNEKDKLVKQARSQTKGRLARNLQVILEAKKRLHANVNPQLLLEQLVIRLQEG